VLTETFTPCNYLINPVCKMSACLHALYFHTCGQSFSKALQIVSLGRLSQIVCKAISIAQKYSQNSYTAYWIPLVPVWLKTEVYSGYKYKHCLAAIRSSSNAASTLATCARALGTQSYFPWKRITEANCYSTDWHDTMTCGADQARCNDLL